MDKVTPTDPKITKQAQYLNIHHKKDNPKFAVVYFGKITHVWKLHFVFMQMQGKNDFVIQWKKVLMDTHTKHYMITVQ